MADASLGAILNRLLLIVLIGGAGLLVIAELLGQIAWLVVAGLFFYQVWPTLAGNLWYLALALAGWALGHAVILFAGIILLIVGYWALRAVYWTVNGE